MCDGPAITDLYLYTAESGGERKREGEREEEREREQSSFPKKERNKINMRHYARH